MSDTMNLNVRISGGLREFVTREIADGDYENASEFIRDLIRQEKRRAEDAAFESLKAELQAAAKAPRGRYSKSSADEIRRRSAKRLET